MGDTVKVSDLRENMDNVNVRVRVLEAGESKVIETRSGPRTISEALVGDESGRVKLTLWGKLAGTIKKGDTIEIRNAWTTTYRGQVQLNVGARGSIAKIRSEEVAAEEEIPEETPKVRTPQPQRPRTGPPREGSRPQRSFRSRR
ncbi:MAG: single-stranded DNA-binding protein [Thermoprotei archaeon]|nr:single-stranded DNA-binding protein [Thermoprotei archaeon]